MKKVLLFLYLLSELLLIRGQDGVMYANVTSSYTLNCSLDSRGSTAWYFNNIPLCNESSTAQQQESCIFEASIATNGNGSLFFSSLSFEHAGWYTCAVGEKQERKERDFLLIVQEPPNVVTFSNQFEYITTENSTVELPCYVDAGHPYPNITWYNSSMKCLEEEVQALTDTSLVRAGSLIIKASQLFNFSDTIFCCEARNVAGRSVKAVNTSDIRIDKGNLPFAPAFSTASSGRPQTLETSGMPQTLRCTNLTSQDLSEQNLTVQWWRDFQNISQDNEVTVNSTGFYCCQVLDDVEPLLTMCATLLSASEDSLDFSHSSISTSLPAGRNRTVSLLCQGQPTRTRVPPPELRWIGERDSPSKEEKRSRSNQRGLSYLQVANLESGDRDNFSCVAFSENRSEVERKEPVQISVVELCNGNNALREISSEEEFLDAWNPEDMGARYLELHFESVFMIEGNSSLRQTVSIPESTGSFQISGRMRQTAGNIDNVAVIRVLLDNSDNYTLKNPNPSSMAWQWVAIQEDLSALPSTLTLELTVIVIGNASDQVVFFDDLCVSFQSGGSVDPVIIAAISLGAAGAIVLVLLVLILFSCCCCRTKKMHRRSTVKMSRVTNTLLRKWKIEPNTTKKKKSKSTTAELKSLSRRTDETPPTAISIKESQPKARMKAIDQRPSPISPVSPIPQGKNDTETDNEDDGYENDEDVAAIRNSLSPPIITTPPPEEGKQHNSFTHRDRAITNEVRDRWNDDFAFIDPKHLTANAAMAHSHSATNLNSYQLETSVPRKTRKGSQGDKVDVAQFKRTRSTGRRSKRQEADKSDAYSYVSLEVEWALGRNREPAKSPKLDSSSEEEVEQPLYQNEHISVGDLLYEV